MTRAVEIEGSPHEPMGLPPDLWDNPSKYDEDIPLWRRTVAFVRDYQHARPQKRDSLVGNLARGIAKDPIILPHVLNDLDLVGQLQPSVDIAQIEEQLITHAEQAVALRPNLPSWTPDKIGQLVLLGLDTKGKVAEATERMKAALFNAPRAVEEAVDLYYAAAWAMVETPHQDVREELFSILCLEKPWLTTDSTSNIYFEFGRFAAYDTHLARFYSFRDTLYAVGKLIEMNALWRKMIADQPAESIRTELREKRYTMAVNYLSEEKKETTRRAFTSQSRKNPARMQRFMETVDKMVDPFYERVSYYMDLGMPYFAAYAKYWADMAQRPWPLNVMRDPNEPLRRFVNIFFEKVVYRAYWEEQRMDLIKEGYQRLTPHYLQVSDNLEIDIYAKNCESPEQKEAIIKKVYAEIQKYGEYKEFIGTDPEKLISLDLEKLRGSPDFSMKEALRMYHGNILKIGPEEEILIAVLPVLTETAGTLGSLIEYRRPLISGEQVKTMEEAITDVREALHNSFVRSISRRGSSVVITDPALRNLGYENITFNRNPNTTINVKITIGGVDYHFLLGSDYRIVLGGDLLRFVSPQDQAWLELITLSHLKKLLCTGEDDEELKNELLGGERQYAHYRRQVVDRIEHLRRLPPGQNYSQEAFTRCLKGHLLLKNLYTINRMRAEIGWGGTPQTGIWTYVSGVEKDIDTQTAKPVKVAFARASEDLRKVIDLGAISPEEMDRIEREILADLQSLTSSN